LPGFLLWGGIISPNGEQSLRNRGISKETTEEGRKKIQKDCVGNPKDKKNPKTQEKGREGKFSSTEGGPSLQTALKDRPAWTGGDCSGKEKEKK